MTIRTFTVMVPCSCGKVAKTSHLDVVPAKLVEMEKQIEEIGRLVANDRSARGRRVRELVQAALSREVK